jgi:hypothetical protein
MPNPNWKPGQSGNPRGRVPVSKGGSPNKKTVLRQELEKDGSALAAAIKAKALTGDTSAQALWLARLEPALRPRGETVTLALDTSLSLPLQMEQVTQAVANGELTIEQGSQIVEMLERLANVRAQADGDSKADALIAAFRQMASALPV